jgi:CheY-like chemotaxis protein
MKKKLNTILLIEDNAMTNFLNKRLIDKLEITENLFIAENGQEGIDYLTHKGKFSENGTIFPRPDLILLDINMPVMDGWEFLNEYKNLPPDQKCEVLIVMLTTSPNPDDEEKALSTEEIGDFIRKPLTKEILENILNKYFGIEV